MTTWYNVYVDLVISSHPKIENAYIMFVGIFSISNILDLL